MLTRLRLVLFVAMLSAILVPAAFARPMISEAAGPGSYEACSTPTLTGPASARVGENYTVTGCGFVPGSIVPLEVTEAGGCCLALQQVADANGTFSHTSYVWGAGLYRVRALVKRKGNGRWRVAATWSFQAYA